MLSQSQLVSYGALGQAMQSLGQGHTPEQAAAILAQLFPDASYDDLLYLANAAMQGMLCGAQLTEGGEAGINLAGVPLIASLPPGTAQTIVDVIPTGPGQPPTVVPVTTVVTLPTGTGPPEDTTIDLPEITDEIPIPDGETQDTIPSRLADWIAKHGDKVTLPGNLQATVRVKAVFRGPSVA